MTPNLRIQLLGEFRLFAGDEPLTTVNSPRQQALLAYLLLHRHAPQPRQQIAFHFWPDSPEGQAYTNLRKVFFQLRQMLPHAQDFLHADMQSLAWRNDTPFTLDVAEVEHALDRLERAATPAAASVQQVISLYRGELLPTCYDDWLLPLRRALHERVVNTLTKALVGLEEQHELEVGLRVAEHLLRLDPLHETAYRHLIHLRAMSGDRAGALRTYHECVTLLEQELGVSPVMETQVLYQLLLKAEIPPVRAFLPAPLQRHEHVPLVGRKQEWQALQQAWQQMASRGAQVMTVWGEAGVGKTRLVEELLRWARLRSGSVVYARSYAAEGALSYAPLTEWLRSEPLRKELRQLEETWQTELVRLLPELRNEHPSLPLPIPMTESWQRQRFYEALARAVLLLPAPRLLILDDLHWCDEETLTWLRYLLRFDAQAPLLVVATVRSEAVDAQHPLRELRQQLQREGQWREMELLPLSSEETTVLAGHLTEQDVTGWRAQLYQETEGNPLFVVEMVQAGLLANVGGAALPSTVQAVITTRLGQLSQAARQLAQVAATIGRAFAVEVLAAASEEDEDGLVLGVDELWQRRIVREQAGGYDFSHDKIREVVYGEVAPMRRRLLHRRVAQAIERVNAQRLPEVAGELAVHFQQAGEVIQARHYYELAGESASAQYANERAVVYLTHALALTPETERETRYRLLDARRAINQRQGRRDAEAEDLAALEKIAGSLGDGADACRCKAQLLCAYTEHKSTLGDYAAAIESAQRAIELAKLCQAIDLEAVAYRHWGVACWARAEYTHARELLFRSLELAKQGGLSALQADCFGFISSIGLFGGLDNYAQTMAYLDQALALFREVGDMAGEALTLNRMGYVLVFHGEGSYEQAKGCLEQALQISRSIGHRTQQSVALGNFGVLYNCLGNYRLALSTLREGLELTEVTRDVRQRGAILDYLGYTHLNMGNFAVAQEYLERAQKLLHENGIRLWEVKALSDLGLLHHLRGEHEHALNYLDQALVTVRSYGDRRLEARALTRRGHALLALERTEEAAASYQAALRHHQEMEQINRSMEPVAGLAAVAHYTGQIEQAQSNLGIIFEHLRSHTLERTEDGLRVHLACYDILRAQQDTRSGVILEMAHVQLLARAATLESEEMIKAFWSMPAHKGISVAVQALAMQK